MNRIWTGAVTFFLVTVLAIFIVTHGQESDPRTDVAELIQMLKSGGSGLRINAAFFAQRLGPAAEPAIPALLDALKDKDPEVRAAIILALADIAVAGDLVMPELARLLADEGESSNGMITELAGVTLAGYGSEALVHLEDALRSEDAVRMRGAAAGLARLGPLARPAIPPLRHALKHEQFVVRRNVMEALGEQGPAARDAVESLAERLSDQHKRDWPAACLALGKIGQQHQVVAPKLIHVLRQGNSSARQSAVVGLANLGRDVGSEGDAALMEALQDEEVEVRVRAAWALGKLQLDPESNLPALVRAMDDIEPTEHGPAYSAIAKALGQFGSRAVPVIVTALADENETICRGAAIALTQFEPDEFVPGPDPHPAVVALVDNIDRIDNVTRRYFILALQNIGPRAVHAVPALKFYVDHDDYHVQYFSCRALAAVGPAAHSANKRLLRFLRTGLPLVRMDAATALGEIGPNDDIQATLVVAGLIGALNDPVQPVRENAVVALGKLGRVSRPAIPMIKQMLTNNPDFAPRADAAMTLWLLEPESDLPRSVLMSELQRPDRPWEAARVLGEIGVEMELVEPIIALLDADSHITREYAAEALGRMGDAARGAEPALQLLLKDKSHEVRDSAQLALDRIAGRAPIEDDYE